MQPPAATPTTAIRATAVSDTPGQKDLLGFEPYVAALARFLREAEPPLTVSIEGKWGSGKSTFMRLLARRLVQTPGPPPIVVHFNPWRHDDAEALWAAFADQFIRGVKDGVPLRQRLLGDLRLRAYQRTPVLTAGLGLAVAAPFLAWGAGALASAWGPAVGVASEAAGVGGGGVTLAATLKGAVGALRNPVERAIGREREPAREGTSSAFIEKLWSDVERILSTYAPERRVYVLIDDLDRSTRAAEMMHALNQLVAEQKRVVFLLAMDREKVAASLAQSQEDILPYLDPGRDERWVGLEYGHQYVEKFIQLPFRLPQPGVRQVGVYFDEITQKSAPARTATPPSLWYRFVLALGRLGPAPARRPIGSVPSAPLDTGAAPPRVERIVEDRDSQDVRAIFTAVAPLLDSNPRRLKQFLNVFRLRTFIAAETGLLDPAEGRPALTLPQIGKFVALTVQWPVLVDQLDSDPGLLARLETIAVSPSAVAAGSTAGNDARWLTDPLLARLLRLGLVPGDAPLDPAAWSLATFPVAALLVTAPRVATVGAAGEVNGERDFDVLEASHAVAAVPGEVADVELDVAGRRPSNVRARVLFAPETWGVSIEPDAFAVDGKAITAVAVRLLPPKRLAPGATAQFTLRFEDGRSGFQDVTITATGGEPEERIRFDNAPRTAAKSAAPQQKMAA